jgi:hypothetical protein
MSRPAGIRRTGCSAIGQRLINIKQYPNIRSRPSKSLAYPRLVVRYPNRLISLRDGYISYLTWLFLQIVGRHNSVSSIDEDNYCLPNGSRRTVAALAIDSSIKDEVESCGALEQQPAQDSIRYAYFARLKSQRAVKASPLSSQQFCNSKLLWRLKSY